ncbi:predicted protein [Coccidioides posadasii str. Silveira]|uniref:Predicted protein n=1 Tax=Coccidioides posadasii (strain RMSCC 757 / Silveira) TaxID=443226 RepID=E9D685_COCPS|nr:predicted protein [Coccidioides posadasii str. Silveira]
MRREQKTLDSEDGGTGYLKDDVRGWQRRVTVQRAQTAAGFAPTRQTPDQPQGPGGAAQPQLQPQPRVLQPYITGKPQDTSHRPLLTVIYHVTNTANRQTTRFSTLATSCNDQIKQKEMRSLLADGYWKYS